MVNEREPSIERLADIFIGLRERGINVDVDGQPAGDYIKTLPPEEARSYTEEVLRRILGITATPENLEAMFLGNEAESKGPIV